MNTKTNSSRKPAFDTDGFHKHIADNLKNNCERLSFTDIPGEFTPVQAHEHAAAVALSCLMMLRTCSDAKPLTRADIQVAIDAAMEGFGVDERRGAMGALLFYKKATLLNTMAKGKSYRLRSTLKKGDVVVLNETADPVYWEVLERTGSQLTVRNAHRTSEAPQYTDTSLVAGIVL